MLYTVVRAIQLCFAPVAIYARDKIALYNGRKGCRIEVTKKIQDSLIDVVTWLRAGLSKNQGVVLGGVRVFLLLTSMTHYSHLQCFPQRYDCRVVKVTTHLSLLVR
jgi:hypothetical protein